MKNITDYIENIPNFPIKGVLFRDITSLLYNPEGFQLAIDKMIEAVEGLEFDSIAVLESRGFIIGSPLAYHFKKPLALIRKKGKLPRETYSVKCSLEYGEAELEIHKDEIHSGEKVLIIDDLLATGGTAHAAAELIKTGGGSVAAMLFLVELLDLKGRDNLKDYNVISIANYEKSDF